MQYDNLIDNVLFILNIQMKPNNYICERIIR